MTVQAQQTLEFKDFSKGMNTYDPVNALSPGYYVDAQNMLLTRKSPVTVGGTTKLNTTAAPNGEMITWCEPYTFGSPAVTTMLVATNAGTLYKYTLTTDLWETLLLGLNTSATVWTHVPFRGTLFFTNGVDPIFKYNGTNVLPVGAILVADMEADETWTAGTVFISNDTAKRREGLRALQLTGVTNSILTYTAPVDFAAGINGAPSFGASDIFSLQVYNVTPANSGFTIRFRDTANPTTKYFEWSSSSNPTSPVWNGFTVARSAFSVVGVTPVWTDISSVQILLTSGGPLIFDNLYWKYALSPPVASVIDLYNQQLVVAGIPADLVALQYSDAGTPDYFPAANIARFSGGRNALEKTDQITALRSYFDELIVGKVNSAWTFSGTGTNVSISALPLTLGIDTHRGVTETPWALHYLFENNIFGSRLTSRGLVSTNISSLLQDIDGTNLDKTVAIRNDRSHIIRWSMRLNSDSGANSLGLLYDYIADAWVSKYTPQVAYYTRATINGNRETLMVQYDGYIRRGGVGTTFDGTAIESYVTLPYIQAESPDKHGNVVRWMNGTVYTKGTADVIVYGRFADDPSTFTSATFTELGRVLATPDGDKGFFDIAQTSRWIQLKFYAAAGSFELMPPVVIGYNDTLRRV